MTQQTSARTRSQPQAAPYRVLVVVDGTPLANLVSLTLNHGLFVARIAGSADEAIRENRAWKAQLAVVQADLDPRLLDLPHSMREVQTRLIALTRRGDLPTKLAAFERGADDILTIPFAPEELIARATALLRRAYRSQVPVVPTIRVGELEIDIVDRNVRVGSAVIHLTPIEQALLYLLVANAGTVVSRDTILDALWGADFVTGANVIERHVRALRAKLGDTRYIQTVRGLGYQFIPLDGPPGGQSRADRQVASKPVR